jgi:low affinity Fe/Cu permease
LRFFGSFATRLIPGDHPLKLILVEEKKPVRFGIICCAESLEIERPVVSQDRGKRVVRSTKSTLWFTRFAKWAARATGRPVTFVIAVIIILAWAITGPIFGFSDTWQLVVNTGTTIVTFLMVFLIQNTQNRDTEALQVKLDELIRAVEGAHNALLDLEELDEEQLDRIRANYEKLAEKARKDLQYGIADTNVADMVK